MRKKNFGIAVLTAVIMTIILNVYIADNKMLLSNIALENVDALAQSESATVICDDWSDLKCKIVVKDSHGTIISEHNIRGINKE